MNITNWINYEIQAKCESMPKFFVMNHNYIPEWKYKIDIKKYEIIGNIRIKKDFNQILMIGINKSLIKNNLINKKILHDNSQYNFPILKSNLQKCIRRSKVDQALKTANLMLLIDPNELLRRLAIIYIEDVMLDNYYSYIVWYMAAISKGYNINNTDKILILNIVKYLAEASNKEKIDVIPNFNLSEYFNNFDKKLYHNNFNYIWCLILRKKYGGMKCDMNLINGCLKLYKLKKIKKANKDIFKDISANLNFSIKDILPCSIDFHCTSIIKYLLKKYKLNYDENYDIYKKCVWYNRSSITNKMIINNTINNCVIDKHKELYRCIKRDLDDLSKIIILKKFNLKLYLQQHHR